MRYLQRALSVRVIVACAVLAAVAGGLLSLLWQPLAYVAVPVFVVAWIGSTLNQEAVLYCPHCRKRVKVGAGVCHHCGRDVRAQA
jgi:hypothetical protein